MGYLQMGELRLKYLSLPLTFAQFISDRADFLLQINSYLLMNLASKVLPGGAIGMGLWALSGQLVFAVPPLKEWRRGVTHGYGSVPLEVTFYEDHQVLVAGLG